MNTQPAISPTRISSVRWAWTWLAAWVAVIVLESFGGSSQNTGRILWPLLHWLWPSIRFLTYFEIHYFLRKIGHLSGYGLLGLLAYRAWWTTWAARRGASDLRWRTMLRRFRLPQSGLALLIAIAVASLDEWHQGMMPGRGSSWKDVLLDSLGAIFVLLILLNVAEWGRAWRIKSEPAPRSVAEPAAEPRQ